MSESLAEEMCRKRIRKEVTCSICLAYFTNPMELGCRHNFCETCILKCWEDKEIKCPECRTVVEKDLKANRLLANLVEAISDWDHAAEKEAKRRRSECQSHQKTLDLFCQDDEVSFCSECDTSQEHSSHRVVPVAEAAQHYKNQLSMFLETLDEVKRKIQERKKCATIENKNRVKKFMSDRHKILAELRHLRFAVDKCEAELEKKMDEVENEMKRRKDEYMAMISRKYDSLQNIYEELDEKILEPPAEFLQDIRSTLQKLERRPAFEAPDLFPLKLLYDLWDIHDIYPFLLGVVEQFRDTLTTGISLQIANVTLDPDTAHPLLMLSEDLRTVTLGEAHQELPDNPERFDERTYVLGRQEITSGRHMWKVTVGCRDIWAVGVARKSVRRKGAVYFYPKDGIWGLADLEPRSGRRSPPAANPRLIWVLVNYAGERITFLDGETGGLLTSFTKTNFCGEPLLPIFCVGRNNFIGLW